MTTLPAACQRDSITLFQPAEKFQVPRVTHWPPLVVWFLLARPTSVPLAFCAMKVAAVERLLPAVHQASMVLLPADGR